MDANLLMDLVKRYEPITRVVKNYAGERLFVVTTPMVREVLMLSTNDALLEKIDLGML